MAWAIYAVQAVAAITQTVSGVMQARSNAAAASEQAKTIKQQTAIEVNEERRRNAAVLSKQQAIAGAAGIDTTSGSPLEVALDDAFTGEMNALQTQYRGRMQAWGKKVEAAQYRGAIPGIIMSGIGKGAQIAGSAYGSGAFSGGSSGGGSLLSGTTLSQGGGAGGTGYGITDFGQSSLLTDWFKQFRMG